MFYKLHTEISGSGEPLVLVHGMGSASSAWKPIRPLLNEFYTVVTVDLPGHGKTPYIKGQPMDPHSLALGVLEQLSSAPDICGSSLPMSCRTD